MLSITYFDDSQLRIKNWKYQFLHMKSVISENTNRNTQFKAQNITFFRFLRIHWPPWHFPVFCIIAYFIKIEFIGMIYKKIVPSKSLNENTMQH